MAVKVACALYRDVGVGRAPKKLDAQSSNTVLHPCLQQTALRGETDHHIQSISPDTTNQTTKAEKNLIFDMGPP